MEEAGRLPFPSRLSRMAGALHYFANPIISKPNVRIRAPVIRVFQWLSFIKKIAIPATKRVLT
jgi:hypothetical protein